MKKALCLLVPFILILASCKKDNPAPVLPSAPEALAEHDNKSGGIYRGAIANYSNSGSFTIILQNGKKEISMRINNIARTLVTNDLNNWTSGEAVNATFSISNWAVEVEINETGSTVLLTFSIAGVSGFNGGVAKELSSSQVKVYEGTFDGTDKGKWNFVWQGGVIAGAAVSIQADRSFSGIATGNTIEITTDDSYVSATGEFTTDGASASGAWTGVPASFNGTWKASRTF